MINDCSVDQTDAVLRKIHASYVKLPVNLGIGGAVQTGYLYALQNQYDVAVQIDGDGQHDTLYLKTVIQPIIEGKADIVIGSRFLDKKGFQSSQMRRFGIGFLSRLIKICCGAEIKDVTSGFRAVNRKFIQLYANEYAMDYPEPIAIVRAALEGARIVEAPVVMKERQGGKSSISARKSFYYMIKVSLDIILCCLTKEKKRER